MEWIRLMFFFFFLFFFLLLFFFRVCLGWVGGWCLEDGEESRNPLQSVWLHCKQLLFLSTIFKHSFTYLSVSIVIIPI